MPKRKTIPVCSPIEKWVAHTEIPGGWVAWVLTDRDRPDKEFVIQSSTDRPEDITRIPADNYNAALTAYVSRVEQALKALPDERRQQR